MPKSKVENDIVEKQKIISSLTLMDDLFMKSFFAITPILCYIYYSK